jgi:hypothetical protein
MRLLHWLAGIALAVVVVGGAGATALGWRLAQGPLELPWLVHRIEASANADGGTTRLSIGSAALAWEGFSEGVDRPLDLRMRDIAVTDGSGTRLLSIPSAEVSLSLAGLLFGRIEPRGIEIDHARIRVYRSATGEVSLDVGSLSQGGEADTAPSPTPADEAPSGIGLSAALLGEFARPAGSDLGAEHSRFRQLRRVRIVDAAMVVVDRQLQATWRAPRAAIDLMRGAAGGVEGHGDLTVTLGDQTTHVTLAAALAPGGASSQLRLAMTPVAPAALARAAVPLAPLSALTSPVGVTATIDLGPALALRHARATVQIGAGEARIGSATIAVVDGTVAVSGDADAVTLDQVRVAFRGHDGGPVSVLSANGAMQREPDRVHADLSLRLDQVAFADLPQLWPRGVGVGARNWITDNITAGTARNGKVDVQLDVRPDFSDATLSGAHGTLDGDGLTVWWLRPIQPIEQGVAQLRIIDPDTLDIAVQSGRQRPEGAKSAAAPGGLLIRGGLVHITGIMQHDQLGRIDADLAGSLADGIALLRSPRLHLFDHVPVDLKGAAGQFAGKLSVSLPMRDAVTMDDIAIGAQARLDDVHLAALVAGRDLDQGAVDLKVNNDGMTIAGQAVLAGIPAKLDAAMDFRAGPPSQVLQTVNVAGQPSAAQLTALGFNPGGVFTAGSAAISATLTERRNRQGQLAVTADLADAGLKLDLAGWSKPTGTPAQAAAVMRLDRDRLAGIDQIRLTGGGASVQGQASFSQGGGSVLQIDQLSVGETSARGTVRFPGPAGGPIVASVSGTAVDLSARLSYRSGEPDRPPAERPASDRMTSNELGHPWRVDARFERALMANGQVFNGLVLRAEDDGTHLTRLHLDARSAQQAPVLLEVVPVGSGRRLTANAADAGGLLRALDVMKTMESGRLSINGTFDDARPDSPLTGSAEIEDFRVRNAPAMARLLQAMTLYGLVDLMGGPGLGFTRLVAPYRLTGSVLELNDARAFSSSLGLTAKGKVDLGNERVDMQGTVVPAYFFNSLLGKVPLIGKLFSPETGGGVFAANYTVSGPLNDPSVSVNPLSALTPGFLRGLFGGL